MAARDQTTPPGQPAAPRDQGEPAEQPDEQDDAQDEAVEESFPASDPPAASGIIGPGRRPERPPADRK